MLQFTFENTSNNEFQMMDDESGEMESTEKKQPSEKVLFEAMHLI